MIQSVFVINLASRDDRWRDAIAQENKISGVLKRIVATEPRDVASPFFTSVNVAACWESHKKAMLELIQTNYDYALIFEDDFHILGHKLNFNIEEFENSNLDFLQLGYLKTTFRESMYIRSENIYDRFIRVYGFLESVFLGSSISRKLLVRERKEISTRFVYADIRPGAHAYIVNRKGALYFTQLNNPIFLSTDDLYMATAPMRNIRMARLRKSVVSQSGSESSIRG